MKVSDLLDLGGGLMPEAELTAFLYRKVQEQETMITVPLQRVGDHLLFSLDPLLQEGDLVAIDAIPEFTRATDDYHIEGEVAHPGSYPVYEHDKTTPKSLYQALTEAGGIVVHGYVPASSLYRKRKPPFKPISARKMWRLRWRI